MLTRLEPFGGVRRRGNMFSDLTDMQEEMNRLFDEFFGDRRRGVADSQWMPAVDVSENESQMVVRAELPGMTHDDIEIQLQDNVLTLTGEKKQEQKQEEGENFHRIERSYGRFSRSFTLSADITQEDIKATFKDGVLEITLPKPAEVKPKKITINAGS